MALGPLERRGGQRAGQVARLVRGRALNFVAWLHTPSGHQGLGPWEGRCSKASYGATACGPAAQGSQSERLTASYMEESSVTSGLDYLVCKMRV